MVETLFAFLLIFSGGPERPSPLFYTKAQCEVFREAWPVLFEAQVSSPCFPVRIVILPKGKDS